MSREVVKNADGRYDYYKNMREDILEWFDDEGGMENVVKEIVLTKGKTSIDGVGEEIQDILWVDDSVTGNVSGSYWFSRWKAEEALCHNFGLILNVWEEFGKPTSDLAYEPESIDVCIRCNLLGEVLDKILDDNSESIDKWICEALEAYEA